MASPDVAAPHDADGAGGNGLPTLFQQFIHTVNYARWSDELGRRERWHESVGRYIDWIVKRASMTPAKYEMTEFEVDFIRTNYLEQGALSSMRALMTAGAAADRDNVAIFNCCAVAVDDPRAFDEAMYLLMCGCGVGFSVERQFVKKLPEVPDRLFPCDDVIVVNDDRKSWSSAYRRLLATLWAGHIPSWDVSRLRPAGERLKTFGGRSSGPAPLIDLFKYTIEIFKGAIGRRLQSVECHGLMCKIGDIVVSGGVRRSALISLSNLSDDRMRDAKSGDWRDDPNRKHFGLANNSAVYTEPPEIGRFMKEWIALYESRSGERGVINRDALYEACERVGRKTTYEDGTKIPFLVNPCAEIILRPCQMCNLTEVVARPGDDLNDLRRKITSASIMGTIQATCTDFDYLRPIWKKNCDEEQLLGVSITGEMDHPILGTQSELSAEWKQELDSLVKQVNAEWADKLGVPHSAMRTCQKPSGTASQLVDSASGGHARHAPFYIRRVSILAMDPVFEVVARSGVPYEVSVYKSDNMVIEWPVKAPEGLKTRNDMTAIDQLERWLHTKRHYTEHNPSCSIEVQEHEWLQVGAWVYKHFDEIGGLSFFPATGGHGYQQLPFEEITETEYERRLAAMPEKINWDLLSQIEIEDQTTSAREIACVSGQCDL